MWLLFVLTYVPSIRIIVFTFANIISLLQFYLILEGLIAIYIKNMVIDFMNCFVLSILLIRNAFKYKSNVTSNQSKHDNEYI